MDGWINGWMDGWVDGWMGGWMDGWVAGWMDGWVDGWKKKQAEQHVNYRAEIIGTWMFTFQLFNLSACL